MAEAFAHIFGAGRVEAYSAGLHPARTVHPKAIVAMQKLIYDMKQHFPKGLSDLPDDRTQKIVSYLSPPATFHWEGCFLKVW
jgi:arsenate reductase (thioredoxin)